MRKTIENFPNQTKTPMNTQKLTGEKLIKTAVNQILQHPETWNQGNWHSSCGTKHCIAGWCQILSGKDQNSDTASSDAAEALGLTANEENWLFSAERTLSDIYGFASEFSVAGYDRAGYNRAGYNRAGYNRAGYDRAGYDRAGYNRAGYDRDGYDRDGYDRDGKKLVPFEI